MAGHGAGGSRDSRGRADGADAGPSEAGLWETAGENQEQFGGQDLPEDPVEAGAPEKERDAGLEAEAEAVAAGWMLDFLCVSLCRAFRDGRSEDFHRTRDSAEGECGAAGGGEAWCAAPAPVPPAEGRRGRGAEGPGLGAVCRPLTSASCQLPSFSRILSFSDKKWGGGEGPLKLIQDKNVLKLST